MLQGTKRRAPQVATADPAPLGPGLSRRALIGRLGVGAAASTIALGATVRSAGASTASVNELLPLDDVLGGTLGDVVGAVTGTATALLSGNPVLTAGSQAYATDTNQLWIGDGEHALHELTPFEAPSGVELASATDSATRSFSNVTTDYPNLAIGPITVPAGKVAQIHLFLPNCYVTNTKNFGAFSIVHGPGSEAAAGTPMDGATCAIAGAGALHTIVDRSTMARLGPGTYTAKVQVYDSSAAGSTDVNFQALAKARLWAILT
jgi:hypothetical protein